MGEPKICPHMSGPVLMRSHFGLKKEVQIYHAPCVEEQCSHWERLRGIDRNTGQEVDQFRCAFGWMNTIQIEGNAESRRTSKEVEALRNETVEATKHVLSTALLQQSRAQQVESTHRTLGIIETTSP